VNPDAASRSEAIQWPAFNAAYASVYGSLEYPGELIENVLATPAGRVSSGNTNRFLLTLWCAHNSQRAVDYNLTVMLDRVVTKSRWYCTRSADDVGDIFAILGDRARQERDGGENQG